MIEALILILCAPTVVLAWRGARRGWRAYHSRPRRNRRLGLRKPTAEAIAGESWRTYTPSSGRY